MITETTTHQIHRGRIYGFSPMKQIARIIAFDSSAIDRYISDVGDSCDSTRGSSKHELHGKLKFTARRPTLESFMALLGQQELLLTRHPRDLLKKGISAPCQFLKLKPDSDRPVSILQVDFPPTRRRGTRKSPPPGDFISISCHPTVAQCARTAHGSPLGQVLGTRSQFQKTSDRRARTHVKRHALHMHMRLVAHRAPWLREPKTSHWHEASMRA
ncbi:hypothetical protein C8Q74DRAFT_596984 [Fomes fomentarius]|nr:hypothetical protein C8Q74DRAFT_596984 [Fomes fomentarius]